MIQVFVLGVKQKYERTIFAVSSDVDAYLMQQACTLSWHSFLAFLLVDTCNGDVHDSINLLAIMRDDGC